MFKKKGVVIALIVIVLLLLLSGGLFFFFSSQEKKKEKLDTKTEETAENTGLENYEDKTKIIYDGDIIDQSESYSQEEQETMKKEVQAALNEYYGLMFDFNSDTKDYTDELESRWVQGYEGIDAILLPNVYKEFEAVNLTSEFQDYYMAVMKIRKNTKLPEVKVHGAIQVHFGCDKLEEGDYSVLSHLSLIKEDGKWRVAEEVVDCVIEQGVYTFEKANEYDGSVNVRCGDVLMKWDFADIQGFLTDYKYDTDIDFSKYTEPGMYILDEEKE